MIAGEIEVRRVKVCSAMVIDECNAESNRDS